MKKSLQCPKCEGRQIAHVAMLDTYTVLGATKQLPMPIVVRRPSVMRAPQGVGGFETFICRACGYSELYAIDFDKLDPAIDKHVRFLDNEPKATLR